MQQTPFHAYYTARMLDAAIQDNDFAPVFASSGIEIYPFQIAAASFALHSIVMSKTNGPKFKNKR